jgi:hypothetical protein
VDKTLSTSILGDSVKSQDIIKILANTKSLVVSHKAIIKQNQLITKSLQAEFAKVENRHKSTLKFLNKDEKVSINSKTGLKLVSVELKKSNKTLASISKLLKDSHDTSKLMYKKIDKMSINSAKPINRLNDKIPEAPSSLLGTLIESITSLIETGLEVSAVKSVFGKSPEKTDKATEKAKAKAERVKVESEKFFNTEKVKAPDVAPKVEAPKTAEVIKTTPAPEVVRETKVTAPKTVPGTTSTVVKGLNAAGKVLGVVGAASIVNENAEKIGSKEGYNFSDVLEQAKNSIKTTAEGITGVYSDPTNIKAWGDVLFGGLDTVFGTPLKAALSASTQATKIVMESTGAEQALSDSGIVEPLAKAYDESVTFLADTLYDLFGPATPQVTAPTVAPVVTKTETPEAIPVVVESKPSVTSNLFQGGTVPGEWNGHSGPQGDSVLAKLTPGEFVVPRAETTKNYTVLNRMMNSATGYADGGLVGEPTTEVLDANRVDIKSGNKPIIFSEATITNMDVDGGSGGINVGKGFGSMLLGIRDNIASGLANAFGVGDKSGVLGVPSLTSNAAAMVGLKDKDPALTGDMTEVLSRITGGYGSVRDETRINFNDPNMNKSAEFTGGININQRSGKRGDANYALPKTGERENVTKAPPEGYVQGPFGYEKKWTADAKPQVSAEKSSTPQVSSDRSASPVTKSGKEFDAVKAGVNFTGGKLIGLSDAQSRAVAAETLKTESAGHKDGIAAENKHGFLGQYQFGAEALASAGLMDTKSVQAAKSQSKNWYSGGQAEYMADSKNWKLEGGKAAFANSKEIQDKAYVDFTNNNIKAGIKAGAISATDSPEKIAAYAKTSHLVGAGGANDYFKRGIDKTDGNKTKASTYAKQGAESLKLASDIESARSNPTSTKPEVAKDYKLGDKTGALSRANQMSPEEMSSWKTQTNAGISLGKTLSDMRASKDPNVVALADKIELTSGNKGEHVKNSQHYKGNAFDFNQSKLTAQEKETFKIHAEKQGLKQDAVVNGKVEPWHYTYRGEDLTKPKVDGERVAKTTDQPKLIAQAETPSMSPEMSAGAKQVPKIISSNISQQVQQEQAPATSQPAAVIPVGPSPAQNTDTGSNNTANYALDPFSQFAAFNRMSLLRGAVSIPGMAVGY